MWGQRSLNLLRHDRSGVQGAREGRAALSQKRWAGAKGPAEHPPTHPPSLPGPLPLEESTGAPLGRRGERRTKSWGHCLRTYLGRAQGGPRIPARPPGAPHSRLSICTDNCNPTGAARPCRSGGGWAKATTVSKVESMLRGGRCPVPEPALPPDRHGSPGARMGHGAERGWAEGLALCPHHLKGACNIRSRAVRDSLGDISPLD